MKLRAASVALIGLAQLACSGQVAGSHDPRPGGPSPGNTSSGGPSGASTSQSSRRSGTTSESTTRNATTCATGDCIPPCTPVFDSKDCFIGCACASTSSSTNQCLAPPVTTYACEPLTDPGAVGCAQPNADGGSPVIYPVGCVSTLPRCSVFSNGTAPLKCECMAVPGQSVPGFVCPD